MAGRIRLAMFVTSTLTFVLFTDAVVESGLHGHPWMLVLYSLLLALVPMWLWLEPVFRRRRLRRR
jgi:hypothetical protein